MGLFSRKKDEPREANVPSAFSGVMIDHGHPRGLLVHKPKTGGVRLLDPPVEAIFPRSFLEKGIADGWVEGVEPTIHYIHTGPVDDPTRSVEAVTHYRYIVFNTLDGQVVYEITQNPGKEDRAYYGRAYRNG